MTGSCGWYMGNFLICQTVKKKKTHFKNLDLGVVSPYSPGVMILLSRWL